MSRAKFLQVDHYAPDTRRRFERAISLYRLQAAVAGVEPTCPPRSWFQQLLRGLIEQHSLNYARQLAIALRYHFRRGSVPLLLNERATRDILQFSKYVGGPVFDIERCDFPDAKQKVYEYATSAYHPNTIRHYARDAAGWETFAERRGIHPRCPGAESVVEYLHLLARSYSYAHVRNVRSAISYYLRCAGACDAAQAKGVDDLLESLRRIKPPHPAEPIMKQQVRQMLCTLGEESLDLRDRVLLLYFYFTGASPRKLRECTTDCWQMKKEYLIINVPGCKRPFICQRIDDRQFDLEHWLKKWTALIPRGYLFPSRTARGSWSREAMSEIGMRRAIQRTAHAAGLSERSNIMGLKKGLIHETVPVYGSVPVAHHLQYRKASSLERHFPVLEGTARAHRRRSRHAFHLESAEL